MNPWPSLALLFSLLAVPFRALEKPRPPCNPYLNPCCFNPACRVCASWRKEWMQ